MKSDEKTNKEANEKQKKKSYTSPKLTSYGKVADLTQGGSSIKRDGSHFLRV